MGAVVGMEIRSPLNCCLRIDRGSQLKRWIVEHLPFGLGLSCRAAPIHRGAERGVQHLGRVPQPGGRPSACDGAARVRAEDGRTGRLALLERETGKFLSRNRQVLPQHAAYLPVVAESGRIIGQDSTVVVRVRRTGGERLKGLGKQGMALGRLPTSVNSRTGMIGFARWTVRNVGKVLEKAERTFRRIRKTRGESPTTVGTGEKGCTMVLTIVPPRRAQTRFGGDPVCLALWHRRCLAEGVQEEVVPVPSWGSVRESSSTTTVGIKIDTRNGYAQLQSLAGLCQTARCQPR